MVDLAPEFESTDTLGSTLTFAGTVGTTPTAFPTVAGANIEEIGIRNALDQPFASRLEFSYDGGVTWLRLAVGEAREDEFRGSIKQIYLRAAGTLVTCKYEIIMNVGQT